MKLFKKLKQRLKHKNPSIILKNVTNSNVKVIIDGKEVINTKIK